MIQSENNSRPSYFDQFKSLGMSRDENRILIGTMNDGSFGTLTFQDKIIQILQKHFIALEGTMTTKLLF